MSALFFTLLFWAGWGWDIKAAQEAAAQTTSILLPPTAPALPEETAWSMLYAEGGVLALVLALGVVALWRIVSKILGESREQNREMMAAQVGSITKLSEAVQRVEGAVRVSDLNNQHAIGRLSDTVNATVVRLDRYEGKLEAHHESLLHHSSRISVLESRRTPPSTSSG